MKELPDFKKYEVFIEEPLNPSLETIELEEEETIPIYQLGQ
jgi:hypothetical protein